MRMIYHYVGDDPRAFRVGFQEMTRSEFYQGTLALPRSGRQIDVLMTRLLIDGISIVCQRTSVPVIYRRSDLDVADGIDICMVWMVLKGSVLMRRRRLNIVAEAGSCLVFRSGQPFLAIGRGCQDDTHVSVQIMLPPSLHGTLGLTAASGDSPWVHKPDDAWTKKLFKGVVDQFGSYAYVTSPSLLSDLKAFIHSTLTESRGGMTANTWERVQAEFQRLLFDPSLSAAVLARNCGVSRRQLFYLFRKNGITFADALWAARLVKAREMIADTGHGRVSIGKVSRLTGFKSAGHFSRMFKHRFGTTPGSFRTQ